LGAFSDVVDPDRFTILAQPDYIFLCGGRLKDFDHSLRAHFYAYRVEPNPDLLKRVQLAEKADEWYQTRKVFADLLELEEYLAGLSACILLFVESPGAIAEFGAFSQMSLLRDKLVVVIEDTYYGKTSFIHNGLVEHLERVRPDSVLSYPWLSAVGPDGTSKIDPLGAVDTLDRVAEEVQKVLAKKPKTTAFKSNDHGHLMLLIADLVTLNVVILQNELQDLLASLKVSIALSELKKYLFLLDKLKLISAFHYGHVNYLINLSSGVEYIGYSSKKPTDGLKTPTDRLRLRALLRKDLPLTSEKNKALSAFSRRPVGGAL